MFGVGDISAIIGLIKDIYKVGDLIYTQAKKVQLNQAQCNRLAERVRTITSTLNNLNTVSKNEQFAAALQQLLVLLTECNMFIGQFTVPPKTGVKKLLGKGKAFFKAGGDEEKFMAFNQRLEACINQLNLGLNVQQIMDKKQDEQDRLQDFSEILALQKQLLESNEAIQGELGDMHVEQKEGMLVVNQQLESIHFFMQELKAAKQKDKPIIESHYLVPFYELEFADILEKGSFATVYKAQHHGRTVAVKRLEGSLSEAEKAEFTQELKIMAGLKSQEVTQLFGVCLEPGRYSLLMEYMEKGSLKRFLEKEKVTPDLQKRLALEIARGLYYLHCNGVIHRDLKSGNVLINQDNHAKISDFGLSFSVQKSFQTLGKQSEAIQWLAPETLKKGGTHTKASDIYSYGMLLWEIVTGKQPFAQFATHDLEGQSNLITAITQGTRETIPASVPPVYAKLIRACWEAEPGKRPALPQIIAELEAYQPKPEVPAIPHGVAAKMAAMNPMYQQPSQNSNQDAEQYYQQGLKAEQQKNLPQAVNCYQQAVNQGHVKAKTNLGFFYLTGQGGVKLDKNQAYQLFLQAAEAGHARAQTNLATMLEKGDGVNQDLQAAQQWYQQAAQQGDPMAQKRYQQLVASSGTYAGNFQSMAGKR